MSEICSQVGLDIVRDPQCSDRVCNPCGRKIRNLGQLFEFVKGGTTSQVQTAAKSLKRALNTPEKASPSWRKSKLGRLGSPTGKSPLKEGNSSKSRKSLAFNDENEDEMLHKLNVDDLPTTGLQVKIVYRNSSGRVIARIPRDDQTKALVRNIADKKWREVSNAVLKHENLGPELKKSLGKELSREFDQYLKPGSNSMLEATDPDELAGFSNKLFVEEVRIYCPVWFSCLLGASGLSQEDVKEEGRDVNSLALSTATLCRIRNPKASAVQYRITTIMFHSGVKHDDLIRLNRLGICMSPDSTIRLQKQMNEQLEGKVQIWKGIIEENRTVLELGKEVLRKQNTTPQLDV